jgi:hypothetical protein
MDDEDVEVIEVSVPSKQPRFGFFAIIGQIWHEITAGIGIWGTFRPVIAMILALVPFLYLGQHFNRNHRRGTDFFLLQIPLSFTLILWVFLYVWSVFDAWRAASIIVSRKS